ncbi:hypothetical protein ACKWRH_03660 [Bradyrhizobium sp. Pa8]|uniref:hypothetical protein n=1 Tax=Bradyrhizobium sp. Pa8 TaxID=3386552 RepID=UPI00403FBE67
MTVGYSIWTEVDGIVRDGLLPHFMHLRRKYGGCESTEDEAARLSAIVSELTWDHSSRKSLNLRLLTPARFIVPLDENSWLLDWANMDVILAERLGQFGWMSGTAAKARGKDFERILVDHLSNEFAENPSYRSSVQLAWHGDGGRKRLRLTNGRKPDLDIGIFANDLMLAIEVKARGASRKLLFSGTIDEMHERWRKRIRPALADIDYLAASIARRESNLRIPRSIRGIVPLVCCPFPEWIVSLDKKFWIYEDIPRVCTPDELLHIVDRLVDGDDPNSESIVPLHRLSVER